MDRTADAPDNPRGNTTMGHLLSGLILYAPGAFFFFPWKPPMQLLFGDTYEAAYHHFRRDHSDATNVVLHCIALVWQLLGNFGMLAAVDDLMFGGAVEVGTLHLRPCLTLTALSWCITLLLSPAPTVCSLVSVVSITTAFVVAPRVSPDELESGAITTFIAVLFVAPFVFKPSVTVNGGRGSGARYVKALAYFGLAIGARAVALPWAGQLVTWAPQMNAALCALMCALSLLPKPVIPCVLGGILVVRPFAELSGQRFLLYYSNAFFAQLAQGIAHDVSMQKATLLSHQDSMADRRVRLAFEWSHVVYFPNLLYQSCHESLVGAKGKTA